MDELVVGEGYLVGVTVEQVAAVVCQRQVGGAVVEDHCLLMLGVVAAVRIMVGEVAVRLVYWVSLAAMEVVKLRLPAEQRAYYLVYSELAEVEEPQSVLVLAVAQLSAGP